MPESNALEIAQSYDFAEESEFFCYIENSFINGNKQQFKDLVNELNREAKLEFLIFSKSLNFECREFAIVNMIGE